MFQLSGVHCKPKPEIPYALNSTTHSSILEISVKATRKGSLKSAKNPLGKPQNTRLNPLNTPNPKPQTLKP